MDKLLGKEFLKPGGGKLSIGDVCKAEVVMLLFSGAWCPPCRGFLPIIKKFYAEINKGCGSNKRVEIVFISCDNESKEFTEHFIELGLPAIPFESDIIANLEDSFEVEAIPILPIINKKTGSVAADNVRTLIQDAGIKCYDELKALSVK